MERFLAYRYFWGKRSGSGFISFIKTMSITGVAIGSAGLLIALSIVHGFKETIQEKVINFAPHITVTSFSNQPLYRADTLQTYLQDLEGLTYVAPIIRGQVIIQFQDQITGAMLKGVPNVLDDPSVQPYLEAGTNPRFPTSGTLDNDLILGQDIAQTLGVSIGDRIIVYSVTDKSTSDTFVSPELKQFHVSHIYNTGIEFFDGQYALANIEKVRELLSIPSPQAQDLELRIQNPSLSSIDAFDRMLDQKISFPYYSETIENRYGNLFAWVELQENIIPLVIGVMILVAAFNLIGAILMMVLERTQDIGVLRTLGATQQQIQRIFLVEGLWVSIIGLLIGMGISLAFVFLQSEFELIRLSEENYYMSVAPVSPHLLDFLVVPVVTIFLCTLASWIPARIGARFDPLYAIKLGPK
jgi:lipoprotein-releasing system permease protein